MAINLEKPLGTDVYNVGVFNNNSTILEEALNPLITNVETIKRQLPNKLDYEQVIGNLDLSSVEGDKIYFVTGELTTDIPVDNLPSGGNIVICYSYNNILAKTLISSDGRLFQKNSTEGVWKALTSTVIDNLITDDSYDSLSAKQGKILNDIKLNITFLTSDSELNLDNADSGIYVGGSDVKAENIHTEYTLPISEDIKDFIFISLGIKNEVCIQFIYESTVDNQKGYKRYGYTSVDDNGNKSYNYSDWKDTDADSSSGGFEVAERLKTLEERVSELEKKNAISVELIQVH